MTSPYLVTTKLALLVGSFYAAIGTQRFLPLTKISSGASLPSNRQKVTGVIVNKKVSAPKKLIRKIRQQLYYCERFGIDDHCEREDIRA